MLRLFAIVGMAHYTDELGMVFARHENLTVAVVFILQQFIELLQFLLPVFLAGESEIFAIDR